MRRREETLPAKGCCRSAIASHRHYLCGRGSGRGWNTPHPACDPAWPEAEQWQALSRAVGGSLLRPATIWQICAETPGAPDCLARLKEARNPIALGDDPGGTQISGWLDGWTPRASAYAVAARSTADVVSGIDFVRRHNLRLVVKGGGHSYLGAERIKSGLALLPEPHGHGVGHALGDFDTLSFQTRERSALRVSLVHLRAELRH
ncbi:FAD binding domain-containing protein [Paraburkholderia tropica]|uniref:FAD binding domain-containing protein n=1 Tax=Paraburkholderia tropica TaxID=92647 RepID=A0AAQ1JXS9_9BURK|nr:FAD binding domain-containing protein [Paraburkholderia tropica]